jgi:Zn-dependent protease with chaperone function
MQHISEAVELRDGSMATTWKLGRLFRTHPTIEARVKRLEAIEQRVQAGGRAIQLGDL